MNLWAGSQPEGFYPKVVTFPASRLWASLTGISRPVPTLASSWVKSTAPSLGYSSGDLAVVGLDGDLGGLGQRWTPSQGGRLSMSWGLGKDAWVWGGYRLQGRSVGGGPAEVVAT